MRNDFGHEEMSPEECRNSHSNAPSRYLYRETTTTHETVAREHGEKKK